MTPLKPINPAAPSPVAGGGSHAARPSSADYEFAAKKAKEADKTAKNGTSWALQQAADAHRVAADRGDPKERAFHAAKRDEYEKKAEARKKETEHKVDPKRAAALKTWAAKDAAKDKGAVRIAPVIDPERMAIAKATDPQKYRR